MGKEFTRERYCIRSAIDNAMEFFTREELPLDDWIRIPKDQVKRIRLHERFVGEEKAANVYLQRDLRQLLRESEAVGVRPDIIFVHPDTKKVLAEDTYLKRKKTVFSEGEFQFPAYLISEHRNKDGYVEEAHVWFCPDNDSFGYLSMKNMNEGDRIVLGIHVKYIDHV